jgi:hypothetical protein
MRLAVCVMLAEEKPAAAATQRMLSGWWRR